MDQNQGNNEKKRRHRRRHRPRHKQGAEQKVQKEAAFSQEEEKKASEPVAPLPREEALPEIKEAEEPLIPIRFPDESQEQDEEKKVEVVGVRFRPVGKTYTFDPAGIVAKMGDHVIVETSQGIEFGTVSTPNHNVKEKDLVLPLKKVLRFADEKDLKKNEDCRELELKARAVFQEKVTEHGLDMALSDVECSFDRSKLIFYFTSEGRVDFRDLVKDLASIFKTRIELRQIGVRDEAKQLGGLGICGRPLCCSSFLEDFQQVSIKMAKEQNLSLNPTKISGTCGRLMCCLRYENDVYVEAGKHCPRADNAVMTPQGKGLVVEANILCGKCKVKLESDPENLIQMDAKDLKVIPKQKKPQPAKEKEEKAEK